MIWLWCGFILVVMVLLWFDLAVLNRESHVVSTKEALWWTAMWVSLGLLFAVFVYFMYENNWFDHAAEIGGRQAVLEYITAFIVEKSLSLDNIFVFAVIFGYFRVPDKYQHRVLFWGILGALVMRGVMIAAGTALLHRFEWFMYVFGVLLLLTAVRLLFSHEEDKELDKNPLVKFVHKHFRVTDQYHAEHFVVEIDGRKYVTPMLLVLLVVESTDVLFAVDSIPAVLAITQDSFIVFTSNVFAILGLRALYFALAGLLREFKYLKPALVIVLFFIAAKMLAHDFVKVPTWLSLIVVLLIVSGGVVLSWIKMRSSQPGRAAPGG